MGVRWARGGRAVRMPRRPLRSLWAYSLWAYSLQPTRYGYGYGAPCRRPRSLLASSPPSASRAAASRVPSRRRARLARVRSQGQGQGSGVRVRVRLRGQGQAQWSVVSGQRSVVSGQWSVSVSGLGRGEARAVGRRGREQVVGARLHLFDLSALRREELVLRCGSLQEHQDLDEHVAPEVDIAQL